MPRLQARSLRLAVAVVYAAAHCCVLLQETAAANDVSPAGYLTAARQATVNNTAAAQGLVVLSNSRIKTAPEGVAAVSLGTAGRLAVGRGADFLLTYTKSSVGGRLDAGRVAVTAPGGVAVSITTPEGTITASGKPGADVVLETVNGQTRIAALNGSEVSIVAGGTAKKIVGGETAEITSKGVEVKAAPRGSVPPAPQNGGGIPPLTLLTLVSTAVMMGFTVGSFVRQGAQNRRLQELLNRLPPSPIR